MLAESLPIILETMIVLALLAFLVKLVFFDKNRIVQTGLAVFGLV